MSPPRPLDIPEISAYCIDFLSDSLHSLSACALVCRSWAHRAQYHLFSNISLKGRGSSGTSAMKKDAYRLRCARLLEIANTSPHIIGLIKRPRFDLLFLEDAIPVLNLPFTRLDQVSISGRDDPSLPIVPALQRLLSLPTIKDVRLEFRFETKSRFMQIWEVCSPNICFLELNTVWSLANKPIAIVEEAESRDTRRIIKLKSLTIVNATSYVEAWLADGRCPLDLSHLHSLDFKWNADLLRSTYFAPALPHIKTLCLSLIMVQEPCDLGQLVQLETLSFIVIHLRHLHLVLQTLFTISTPSHSKVIDIALSHWLDEDEYFESFRISVAAITSPQLQVNMTFIADSEIEDRFPKVI
ncbi:hypothetical protein B0H11DRAFT_2028113 [Mycena galericulata]|nr:hypothetical protein B0H11DRAFT_2028113 [Mycena galericulata]